MIGKCILLLPVFYSLLPYLPPRGIRGGLIHSGAHIVNLLTNEIHARKSVRKYAILAHSATLWLSEHCKTGEKMTVFFRPKRPKKRPKSIDIER